MAKYNSLKDEKKLLCELFPKSHSVFQIVSFNPDEIICKFTSLPNIEILGNIPDSYPRDLPVWFLSSDFDVNVWNAIEKLQTSNVSTLTKQLKTLIYQVCSMNRIQLPPEYSQLSKNFDPSSIMTEEKMDTSGNDDENSISSDADDTGFEDGDNINIESLNNNKTLNQVLSEKDAETLQKVKAAVSRYSKNGNKSTIQASDRLMKELRSIYQSETYKSGHFSVELVNESLYDWDVRIFKFDEESLLANDLKTLSPSEILPPGIDGPPHVALQILFKEDYPFHPPFVRIKYPIIHKGFVLDGGAICMELLTTDGWSSAYNIESLLVQICATLVNGKARVWKIPKTKCAELVSKAGKLIIEDEKEKRSKPSIEKTYSLNKAQKAYKYLVEMHEKNGWFTPPKSEG